jgi:alkylation response protein AidB-like acyl-CoA dehydrogenase
MRTNAVADGDDWILNGSKTFITNGFSKYTMFCCFVLLAND